jgi:hypothetical protein
MRRSTWSINEKNCRIRADAEPEREHDDGREGGRAPKRAESEAEVLSQGIHSDVSTWL